MNEQREWQEHQGQTLGDIIRQRRLELGWSQETLAERVGTYGEQISRLENRNPKTATAPLPSLLNAVARELRIPMERLVRAAGYDLDVKYETGDDESLQVWMAEGEELTPEERRRYINIMRFLRSQDSETGGI